MTVEDFLMKKESGSYWCNACGFHSKNNQRIDVTRHIESKHLHRGPIFCKFCQKPMKTKFSLQRHIRHYHWNGQMNMKEMMEWHGLA